MFKSSEANSAVVKLVLLARLYESTASVSVSVLASAWCWRQRWSKFLNKVFETLYLMNLCIEIVQTCLDVTYWFEKLCCTILTRMTDLEVKVTDLEKIYVKAFFFKFLKGYIS